MGGFFYLSFFLYIIIEFRVILKRHYQCFRSLFSIIRDQLTFIRDGETYRNEFRVAIVIRLIYDRTKRALLVSSCSGKKFYRFFVRNQKLLWVMEKKNIK